MKIHSLRMMHANNSSSTHSIVLMPPNADIHDDDVDSGEFGWNFFTAASVASKRQYIGQLLFDQLSHEIHPRYATMLVEQMIGQPFIQDGYVDHQSAFVVPVNYEDGRTALNEEFVEDLIAYVSRYNVAILGGNDNLDVDEQGHSLAGIGKGTVIDRLPMDNTSNVPVARKENGVWTLFYRHSGLKIRFSFDGDAPEPKFSTLPELVDLKITDFCDIGCRFCYQGSTKQGKHANTYNYIEALKTMDVFEVAIGGGEPTTHPEFADILRRLDQAGINANFTTKSFAWLEDPKRKEEILKHATSFAFSVVHADEIKKLCKLLTDDEESKASIQVVMGAVSKWQLEYILRDAKAFDFRVTLLGFKEQERGVNYKQDWDYRTEEAFALVRNWTDDFRKVGIDTKLAQEWQPWLQKAGVAKFSYHTEEGRFSCYIDAVTGRIAPSSYCPQDEYIQLKETYWKDAIDEIKQAYLSFAAKEAE